ncbi:universal stress protein [Paenarthrobacter aromaticivorans]|uniref:universal stress protein n=1 Tax=Paenarthrobacter aromaticivorans TaxID=2849150 RepID=UPI003A802474
MRYVVGYTPNERGSDAVALALAMARAQSVRLDLVYVLDSGALLGARNPGAGPVSAQERAVAMAQRQGLSLVPDDVSVEFHVRNAPSFAAGLIDAARGAGMIVVGAANNGPLLRHTVGSVANALLHASPVPVALAPAGYRPRGAVSRLTLAVGQREGADAAIDTALDFAVRRGLPLRLVSLVELDARGDSGEVVNAAHIHANTVLTEASLRLPQGHNVTVEVAHGRSIEECIDDLEWDDREILIVGSSRLAEKSKLFIGSTAHKVLRALPVPMVVIPRDYQRPGTATVA